MISDNQAILCIYTFAREVNREKNCCGCTTQETKSKRVLRETALLATSIELAQEWRRRLLWALESKVYRDECDPKPLKALVLLNPFGGAGAARQNWAIVEHMFQKAHMEVTLRETQYANHAYEIVND